MWMPTSYVVFHSFDPASIKKITGFVSTGTAVGLLFFPPLENLLIENWGLQAAFLAVGLIVLAFTILAYESSRNSGVSQTMSLGEAVQLLKTRKFGFLYTYYAAGNAFSRSLVTIFLVPLLESRGLGVSEGTLALVLIGVGSLIGRLTAGTKRLEEETVAGLGFILQGFCALGMFLSSDPVSVAVLSVLFGVGYGAYIPEFALLVRKYYGLSQYGTIFGVLLTSFGIGGFIGPVFEGVAVSSGFDYLPGFLSATVVSVLVGIHLLTASRKPKARVDESLEIG